jgi:hypothetical protein
MGTRSWSSVPYFMPAGGVIDGARADFDGWPGTTGDDGSITGTATLRVTVNGADRNTLLLPVQ